MVNGKSASSMSFSDIGNKELLEFYQNKFDELQKKDDKYREKVDKHLKELIADRYELEAEVYRRGEKISDLQKGLVDLQLSCFQERERFLIVSAENERLKNNEEILHKNVQQLLKSTNDRELRDKIIYILQDPKVDICYRYADGKSTGNSVSSLADKKIVDHGFKEQVQELQSKIDQFSQISKTNSDVLLEDCKLTLAKSKEKILEDEEEIRKLQRRLQETEVQLCELKKVCSKCQQDPENKGSSSFHKSKHNFHGENVLPSVRNTNANEKLPDNQMEDNLTICSHLKNIIFALLSLSKVTSKISTIFKNIFSSQIFIKTANLSRTEFDREFVDAGDITELQNSIRQCTRLSCDISNIWKAIQEYRTLFKIRLLGTHKEIDKLDNIIFNLAVLTADIDLIAMRLSKATFFDYLTRPTPSFERFGVKETSHSKYAAEVINMEKNVKSVDEMIETANKLVQQIVQKTQQNKLHTLEKQLENKSSSSHNRSGEQVRHFSTHYHENAQENLGVKSNENLGSQWGVRRTRSEPIGGDDVKRKIDKTLYKIEQIENGEYFKDKEFGKHLAVEIDALSQKLKLLSEDFNAKDLQDHFSEYSAVTLSKLETLGRQSRDTVLNAEAQISAYRSNVKTLSEKLKNTEELLRESMVECLDLKKKVMQLEIRNQREKLKFGQHLEEKLQTVSDFDDLETAVKEVVSTVKPSTGPRKPEGAYECMFCKQGSDHKLCEEKIRDLRANVRKLSTELKILNQELKEEKKTAKISQVQAEKVVLDSLSERENVKETLQSLESNNASLLDQLKVAKNRIKNMERYRRAEIEGFQTDIKNLKSKIQNLEKQLTKAVLIYENDQKNIELLKTVHATALRSKTAVGSLKRLKAKLYEIETDIKRL